MSDGAFLDAQQDQAVALERIADTLAGIADVLNQLAVESESRKRRQAGRDAEYQALMREAQAGES